MADALIPIPSIPTFDDALDLSSLDNYDDAQLDDLPFGVICIDDSGTILKYNLAEARLARLDRSRVLGKNFFRQIAPCTATPEFEGRFRQFLASREPRISFPYVFDFKFGAQQVQIEIVRATVSRIRRFFVCVNRMKFGPARAAFAQVQAPRQAELTPDEAALGVQRDDAEQRVVMLPEIALRALRLTWDKIAPEGWSLFAAEWGSRWGRLAVLDIETALQETRGRSLRELPLDEALAIIRDHIERDGWGRIDIDVTSSTATTRGAAIITIERSALAEASGESAMPRCQLIGGLIRAMLGHAAQRQIAVREVRCTAQGAPRCELLAVAHSRRGALDAAVAGASDARTALASLDGSVGPTPRAGDVLGRLF